MDPQLQVAAGRMSVTLQCEGSVADKIALELRPSNVQIINA